MPVVETMPAGTARPWSCVSRSTSIQRAPACARTVRAAGSTRTPRICDRSIVRPPSHSAPPAMLWPPERTETRRRWRFARRRVRATSAGPAQRTTSAGRGATSAFHRSQHSRYTGSPGNDTWPPRLPASPSSSAAGTRTASPAVVLSSTSCMVLLARSLEGRVDSRADLHRRRDRTRTDSVPPGRSRLATVSAWAASTDTRRGQPRRERSPSACLLRSAAVDVLLWPWHAPSAPGGSPRPARLELHHGCVVRPPRPDAAPLLG